MITAERSAQPRPGAATQGEPASEPQQLVVETRVRRDQAQAVLNCLLKAKAETEQQLSRTNRSDAFREVTGKSAIDGAIASTTRMVETLNQALNEAQRRLQRGKPSRA